MRAAVFHGAWDVRVEDVPDPVIREATDAIVRVTHAGICGSDLWRYRGVAEVKPGYRAGHEWMGLVEAAGSEVATLAVGDLVLAPFAYADGTCGQCLAGLPTSCTRGGYWGGYDDDGGQGELVRSPWADATLVRLDVDPGADPRLLTALLTLADVMCTGHHAALSGGVERGARVVVIGDGAVGLCAVLASRRLGAERVVAVGRHTGRLHLAATLGATDTVAASDDLVGTLRDMTDGGAEVVLECVGAQAAMDAAIASARPGGTVGYVGVPHEVEAVDLARMFDHNIALRGGVCPARTHIPELLSDVLSGALDPSPVFDLAVGLEEVPDGYAAMEARQAIKVLVRPA